MSEKFHDKKDDPVEILFQSGLMMLQEGHDAEAADTFRHLLALDPARVEAWHNLGHACKPAHPEEAEHAFRAARRLAPKDAASACSLAEFLTNRERFEESLTIFKEVLALQPDNIHALAGAGHACQQLFRSEEARNFYEVLLRTNPDDTDALNNLGVLYRESGNLTNSRSCFEAILARMPAEGDAHWNLSHTLLVNGDLQQGWNEYEWRFCRTAHIPLPELAVPRWQGEPLQGRTILLWSEQAYGDTFQFIRYAELLNNRGATVVVIAQDRHIAQLLATSSGVSDVILRDQPMPQADFWIPLLSLSHLFDTTIDTIPCSIPYLNPAAAVLKKWQQQIPASDALRIGIVWAGRSRPDPRRSCPPGELLPLQSVNTRCRWYSLQVGAGPEHLETLTSRLNLTDLATLLTDFGETAAALCCLDLVITIDTSVAHLAGALGIPTWLMLPFAPDWRWLLDRQDSPWYPAMRIFRQPAPGDWSSVIRQIAGTLDGCCPTAVDSHIEQPEQIRLLDESDCARQNERWQESLNLCLTLLASNPLHPLALLRTGGCLLFLRQPQAARRWLERAISRDPKLIDAHINLALACLTTSDYDTGWREFEWRLRNIHDPLPPIPQLPAPGIPLDSLRGATLLVHTEQGFGDTLQFVRYLPLLARLGMQVILSAPPTMTRLLANLAGVQRIIPHGEVLPVADYQIFLLSTPLLVQEVISEPLKVLAYLTPPSDLSSHWATRLPDNGKLRVGLAWAGREMKQSGYRRSLNIRDCLPLLKQPGVTFISLQTGPHAADITQLEQIDILDCSADIGDFADTAAIIAQLDLIITIDTSVAHLAGAMGKPTWVALLHAPDWRWGLDGEESVWYPSMQLFRQPESGAWEPVIAEMAILLKGEILIRQGHVLGHKGERNQAIQTFREAAVLTGKSASAWLNLGIYLRADGQTEDARQALLKAVETGPDYPEAWQNLALVHQSLRALPEAYTCFRRALALRPDYPTARWNLGLLQLLLGEYPEGFKNLEARFDTITPLARLHQEIPRWDGTSLTGKQILIHAEQGYGDTIQFIRYLPLLAEMGGLITLEVQDRSLLPLARSLGDTIRVISRGEPLPPIDVQIPLLSLPLLLGTQIDTIPTRIPYLSAGLQQVEYWKKFIVRDGRLRVGLAWKGRPTPDPGRSVPFAALALFFARADIAWYSLQMDNDPEATLPESVIDTTGQIRDFGDTAALIANLDLVICIDSALAHLTGAVGIPGIVMLQAAPDWRWGLDRDIALWYPALRLVRQSIAGEWHDVVITVAEQLERIAANRKEA
jgi:tetratricopeptide (TPR) repeat protein